MDIFPHMASHDITCWLASNSKARLVIVGRFVAAEIVDNGWQHLVLATDAKQLILSVDGSGQ